MNFAKKFIPITNNLNKDTWCVNAFHGMAANNDGTTKMCCMIKNHYSFMSQEDVSLTSKTIKENFNCPAAQKIRHNLDNGIKDPSCEQCWLEEASGRKSKRIRDIERYQHEIEWLDVKPFNGLAKFELNLGNTCNIKCRTCHPVISSQWMKEDYDINSSKFQTYQEYSNKMKKYHQSYDEDSIFWKDLENNLTDIRQFDFYGGEPFLSKKMWEILQICVDKGYAKNIELHYNTNGTIWPKDIALWKNFKSVNLSFSIDGIGEKFEFMRFPADWPTVKENMQKALDFKKIYPTLYLSWCITLSTLNIYSLDEILEEYQNSYTEFGMYLNLVHRPSHFNISNLPTGIKEEVLAKLESIDKKHTQAWTQLPGIISFIKNGHPSRDQWKKFKQTVRVHDQYRNQNFYSTFPKFTEVIKRYE